MRGYCVQTPVKSAPGAAVAAGTFAAPGWSPFWARTRPGSENAARRAKPKPIELFRIRKLLLNCDTASRLSGRQGSIIVALARLQFFAIGENYFSQTQHFRAVFQAIPD